jgi:hypothetical protein
MSYRRLAAPSRRGSVLPWVVVSLGVIVAVVALGLDGGRMMDERRHAQATADAAALAAAADLFKNYSQNQGLDPKGTAAAAADQVAAANGYANDGVTSLVVVNSPPQYGPFAGMADYIEVIIKSWPRATFSAIFNQGPPVVSARAVARSRPNQIGVLTLSSSGKDAFQVSGSGIVLVNGAVIVNSTDAAAFEVGNSSQVQADSFQIAGGYKGPPSSISGQLNTGVARTLDPLAALPAPDPTAYPVQSTAQLVIDSGGSNVLQPGVYLGGIYITSNAKVTLQPGVYILNGGGLQMDGNSGLKGDGVMIYNTGGAAAGPISLHGGGGLNLTAPTSGIYQGLSFFQDRAVTQAVSLQGSSNSSVSGMVYAPGAAVLVSGSGSSLTQLLGGSYISQTLSVSGSASFHIMQGPNAVALPDILLVD